MILPMQKTKLRMLEIVYRKWPIPVSKLFKEAKASPQAGYRYLKELLDAGIILEKLEGKKPVLRYILPNLKNKEAISVFSLMEADREKDFFNNNKELKGPFEQLKTELENIEATAAIFGSFARGSETKDSDLDILFILKDKKEKRKIDSACEKSFVTLKNRASARILTYTEFITLKRKGDSFIAGIIKDHICIYNQTKFVELLGIEVPDEM